MSLRFGSIPTMGRSEERLPPLRMALGRTAQPEAPQANWSSPQPHRLRTAVEAPRSQVHDASSSSSRIPHGQMGRKPPQRQGHSRPPLTHQDKSWGSASIESTRAVPVRPAAGVLPVTSSYTEAQDNNNNNNDGDDNNNDNYNMKRRARNVLRRRSSNMIQDAVGSREISRPTLQTNFSGSSISRSTTSPESYLSSTQHHYDITDSPAEIQVGMQIELPTTNSHAVHIYPELDRYGGTKPQYAGSSSSTSVEVPYHIATHDLPPPTPLFSGTSSQISGYSGSPSTGFSGSPGICPYSRDTTPTTSIPSQSPALMASSRFAAAKMKQNSPAHSQQSSRPPVARRRAGSTSNEMDGMPADPHGLAAVREALNSSSSGSTVRGSDRKPEPTLEVANEAKQRKLRMRAPSPPPRTSSEKQKKKDRELLESSPSKTSRQPATQVMSPKLPERAAQQPPPSRVQAPSPSVTSPRATPPVRPSRDGTGDLMSQYGLPVPVIHSNLSSSSITTERRQSLPIGPSHRAAVKPANNGARSVTPSQQPVYSKPSSSREPTPAPRSVETRRPSHGSATSRSPSPGLATFRTRFPLFGRRKTAGDEPAAKAPEKKEKTVRKGPAAGTGHEGYGRVGMTHKRRSSLSRGIAGTMSSQESLDTRFSDDPFILERTKPVVIAGGEIIQNDNIGPGESSQSLPTTSVSMSASQTSLASQGDRNTLWPSALPRHHVVATGNRRPSDSSDSEGPALAMRSTLAYRRSMQKLKDGKDASAVRMPKPINTRPPQEITSPTMTSFDTSIMSDDSVIEMTTGRVIQGPRAAAAAAAAAAAPPPVAAGPKKLTKRAKSPRRWNFFGRSTSQAPSTSSREPTPAEPRKVTAQVQVKAAPRPKAFYTMDMSEQEDNADPAAAAQKALMDARLFESPPQPPVQPQPPTQPHIPPMGRRQSVRRSITSPVEAKRGVDPQPALSKLPMGPGKRASLTNSKPSEEPSSSRRAVTSPLTRPPPVTSSSAPLIRPPPVTAPATRRLSSGRTTPAAEQEIKRGGVVEPFSQRQRIRPPLRTQNRAVTAPELPVAIPKASARVEQREQPKGRTGRPSRLPQVGRIPKVVSARPEPTSPKSFSRPFHRISLLPPAHDVIKDPESVAKGGPSPPRAATPEPAESFSGDDGETTIVDEEPTTTTNLSANSPQRFSREMTPDIGQFINEFLAFSPRKNSQSTSSCATTSASSSGGIFSYADATAVVPAPNAPLAEDEVWLEFDDLVGDEGLKVPPSAGSSQGAPFHLEQYRDRLAHEPVVEPLESPTFSPYSVQQPSRKAAAAVQQRQERDSEVDKEPVASSIYSTDETRLLNEALEMGVIPISSSIGPLAKLAGGSFEDRPSAAAVMRQSATIATAAVSAANATRLAAQRSVAPENDSPRRRMQRSSDASGSSGLSDDNSPLSQVNLRVGSMTVSKWLTFGHVLFSPVRDELVPVEGSLKRHSILVIDGLGNDDWSFYAAETYPEATFFNLSPRAPLSKSSSGQNKADGTFPLSPPNHHQIQYGSLLEKFPFGAESFIAVVFRFPAAAPEAHFRNVVSEAHRVLKPGGYIEFSILDLDLNNMGNRSRRMVRRLKERIHAVAPDTCLGSTADLLLRLAGRKGFVDIKSCRVGVPVASSTGSGKSKGKKDERTLAEMISDDSRPVADESITKVVAKVGRWWFSRCYESAVLGANSMWNDRCLLAECEEWGTSLKLMVCHARVPDGRTRVASI